MEFDDYLPLSGLQHLIFCERQCALIHVERLWHENVLTAKGRVDHQRVHEPDDIQGDLRRTCRSLHLSSHRLRISGQSDVVEFTRGSPEEPWIPFPVEYKHGTKGHRNADKVQLCAQAICLEEMLGVEVNSGAIYYQSSKRRVEVQIDKKLRSTTEKAAKRFHELVEKRETPKSPRKPKCNSCSFLGICLPGFTGDLESYRSLVSQVKQKMGQ